VLFLLDFLKEKNFNKHAKNEKKEGPKRSKITNFFLPRAAHYVFKYKRNVADDAPSFKRIETDREIA